MNQFHVEASFAGRLNGDQLADIAETVGGVVQYDSEAGLLTVTTTVQAEAGRSAYQAAGAWMVGLTADVPHLAAMVGPVRFTVERADTRAWRMPLVGTAEIAAMLGVSGSRVRQLAERPDFPHPVASLVGGHIYRTSDVLAFKRSWARQPGRPPAADAA